MPAFVLMGNEAFTFVWDKKKTCELRFPQKEQSCAQRVGGKLLSYTVQPASFAFHWHSTVPRATILVPAPLGHIMAP